MNDTLVFTHIYSNTEAAEWTTLTVARHIRYCSIHNMDYQYIQTDPLNPSFGKHNIGHWAIPYYLFKLMHEGIAYQQSYQNIIYLDHDCIIADMDIDLRDACMPDKIGAVWHDYTNIYGASHYNDGVLYVSNTAKVRAFVDKWLEMYPGDERWHEQGAFNKLGIELDIINRVDDCWNAGYINKSDHPVVMGFHGQPYRFKRMQEALDKLK